MNPELLPWVLTALAIALVGAAVLLLALDSSIRRGIELDRSRQCNLHGEWIGERQHREKIQARHEQAVSDQFALGSLTSAARG